MPSVAILDACLASRALTTPQFVTQNYLCATAVYEKFASFCFYSLSQKNDRSKPSAHRTQRINVDGAGSFPLELAFADRLSLWLSINEFLRFKDQKVFYSCDNTSIAYRFAGN
jgi:hypothetical protein